MKKKLNKNEEKNVLKKNFKNDGEFFVDEKLMKLINKFKYLNF